MKSLFVFPQSARVTLNYRALALKRPDAFLWFWIGDHKSYEELI